MSDETTEQQSVAVGSVTIRMGEDAIVFTPADDMTGKECALVMQMFLNGMAHKGKELVDFGTFIANNKLERHFSKLEEPK